jgi:hypothetical protein
MVRDGVDAISGSFESPRWLHTVSHSGAVVSDSTPLRPLARSPPPPPPRAAGVPRFRVTGAPRGRARAGDETYLLLIRTRALGDRLRNHLPTVYRLHVLHI